MLTQLAVALGLAADCFAVSVCIGMSQNAQAVAIGRKARPAHPSADSSGQGYLNYYFPALSFGVFQVGMTGTGYLAGAFILPLISAVDHWIAFGLLSYVGLKMAYSSYMSDSCPAVDTNLRSILMVSVATSIDALAVGISLALITGDFLSYLAAIGVVAFIFSAIGLKFGHRLGKAGGKWSGIIGGLVLVLIGFQILLTHLGIIA
ncbi:MAG: manganese efflux pump MntP family protein [Candidatus Micrarchaeia archaeon]